MMSKYMGQVMAECDCQHQACEMRGYCMTNRIEELETENKNLRHMNIDQIKSAGDDPEIMAASRAEWAARAKAAEAKLKSFEVLADYIIEWEAKLTLQPIETAPMDGTKIIVVPYSDVTDLQVSWFINDEGRWANWDWSVEPSYWMPMPFALKSIGGNDDR